MKFNCYKKKLCLGSTSQTFFPRGRAHSGLFLVYFCVFFTPKFVADWLQTLGKNVCWSCPEEIFATLTSHSFKKTWKRRTGRHPGGKFRVRRHKCFKEDQRNPVTLISSRSWNTLVSFFFGVRHEANAASMFRSFYQFNFYGFTLKIYSTPGSKTLQTHTGQSQHSIF